MATVATSRIQAAIETGEALGRKFTWQDVQNDDRGYLGLFQAAIEYTASYSGDFPFVVDLKRRGIHSSAQAAGILNCLMAQVRREKAQAPKTTATTTTTTTVLTPIKDGTYTVALNGGGDYVTLQIRTAGAESKLAGQQIASFLAGPDNDSDYRGFAFCTEGLVRVWKRFDSEGRMAQALRAMMGDPEAAAQAGYTYAMQSGKCYRCGRTLTVPASLHRGMGPVCAGRE